MQINKYELKRLYQMIRDAEEYKRTHCTEMMIVMSDAGLQGFALRDKSIYPVVWRSDTGMATELEVEQEKLIYYADGKRTICGVESKDSARPFISERFERCE